METKNSSFSFQTIKGIFFQILSVFSFAFMIIVARFLYKTTAICPFEVVVWRSIVLTGLNFAFAVSNSVDIIAIKPTDAKVLFYRLITGVIAVFGFFLSPYLLPPSIVSSVLKLNPLLTTLFSVFLMNERVSKIEIAGMIIAFGGVLLIAFNPVKVSISLAEYLGRLYLFAVPLMTALGQASSAVLIRIIGQTLHYIMSPTYLGIACTIVVFPILLGYLSFQGFIVKYTFWDAVCLFMVGFLGWSGQVTASKALQSEKAGRIMAINFDTVLLLLFDVFYFGESITFVDIAGMTLIMVTVIGIALLKGCQVTR